MIKIGDNVKTPFGNALVEGKMTHREVLRSMSKRDARVLVAQLRQKIGNEAIGKWYRVFVKLHESNLRVWLDSTDIKRLNHEQE